VFSIGPGRRRGVVDAPMAVESAPPLFHAPSGCLLPGAKVPRKTGASPSRKPPTFRARAAPLIHLPCNAVKRRLAHGVWAGSLRFDLTAGKRPRRGSKVVITITRVGKAKVRTAVAGGLGSVFVLVRIVRVPDGLHCSSAPCATGQSRVTRARRPCKKVVAPLDRASGVAVKSVVEHGSRPIDQERQRSPRTAVRRGPCTRGGNSIARSATSLCGPARSCVVNV
jgi:hypothetical protein